MELGSAQDDVAFGRRHSRRAVVGTALGTAAAAWVAPMVISVPAAAAGTSPPGFVIDPFTIAATVTGAGAQSAGPIDPVQGIPVTRTIRTTTAPTTLTIGGSTATLATTGGAAQITYDFATPLDLSAFTEVNAPCTFTGTLGFLLLFVSFGGGGQQAFPLAVTPVARFDLIAASASNRSSVTQLTLVVGTPSASLNLTLGPLSAS